MHFVLQARESGCIAVGIKLIVKLEYHAQRILRAREGLQVPGSLPEEVATVDNLQTQISDIAEIRHVGGKFEHFTKAQRRACLGRRGSTPVLDCLSVPTDSTSSWR